MRIFPLVCFFPPSSESVSVSDLYSELTACFSGVPVIATGPAPSVGGGARFVGLFEWLFSSSVCNPYCNSCTVLSTCASEASGQRGAGGLPASAEKPQSSARGDGRHPATPATSAALSRAETSSEMTPASPPTASVSGRPAGASFSMTRTAGSTLSGSGTVDGSASGGTGREAAATGRGACRGDSPATFCVAWGLPPSTSTAGGARCRTASSSEGPSSVLLRLHTAPVCGVRHRSSVLSTSRMLKLGSPPHILKFPSDFLLLNSR